MLCRRTTEQYTKSDRSAYSNTIVLVAIAAIIQKIVIASVSHRCGDVRHASCANRDKTQ